MSTTKHTAGPWKITRAHGSPCSIEDEAHPGVALAKVYLTDADTRKRTPEALANAHIIAAAPDLLAALEEAVKLFGRRVSDANRWEVDARAAIARARGVSE